MAMKTISVRIRPNFAAEQEKLLLSKGSPPVQVKEHDNRILIEEGL
jgi:hypothetical protein